MADIHGRCEGRFEGVRDALARHLAGEELGASSSWTSTATPSSTSGVAGATRPGRPWTEDTITNVWSTTKTVTNLAALMLIDRGLLDAYAPVADHWPEFAASGKRSCCATSAHTSGVSGWDAAVSRTCTTGRRRPAAWRPRRRGGSRGPRRATTPTTRAISWASWCAASRQAAQAVRRRADCRSSGRRLPDRGRRTRLAPDRAGRAAAPAADRPRLAAPESPMFKTFTGPVAAAGNANTPGWRRADMGALNGHANARSVARIIKALALGGVVNGTRLLSPDTIELIFDEQSHGTDLVLGVPLRFGIGYALPETETVPYVPQGRSATGAAGAADRLGSRPPRDLGVHDEQHGAGHHRLRPRPPNTGRRSTTPSPRRKRLRLTR